MTVSHLRVCVFTSVHNVMKVSWIYLHIFSWNFECRAVWDSNTLASRTTWLVCKQISWLISISPETSYPHTTDKPGYLPYKLLQNIWSSCDPWHIANVMNPRHGHCSKFIESKSWFVLYVCIMIDGIIYVHVYAYLILYRYNSSITERWI